MKSNHKNFVHLVGLYTYFKMMYGAYNIKPTKKYFTVGSSDVVTQLSVGKILKNKGHET